MDLETLIISIVSNLKFLFPKFFENILQCGHR